MAKANVRMTPKVARNSAKMESGADGLNFLTSSVSQSVRLSFGHFPSPQSS